MKSDLYLCICCRGELIPEDRGLSCKKCGRVYPVVNGIPYFTSAPAHTKPGRMGLTASLFDSPFLYDGLTRLKLLIARDQKLGIRDLTDGHSLLDIGCGPNANSSHLEYDVRALSAFAALDVAPRFVESARKRCDRKDAEFCVASIEELPYADSSFDVVLISFVLHHLSFPVDAAIREALRVARGHVVVFDHVKSEESLMWKKIQEIYWRVFDGGQHYLTASEWDILLKGHQISRAIHTGAIGKHVYKFALKKNGNDIAERSPA